ncbi:MAG: AI-2E family transporter [Treponema sp.]|nr:AI-2E family transporter [Treponema sp.]
MEESDYTRKIYFVLLASFVILLGFLFKILSSVFLPVITAALIACVFAPIIQKINYKFKIPWTALAVIITSLLFIVILGISSLLISSATSIVADYPKYETRFLHIYKIVANNLGLTFDEGMGFIGNMWQHLKVREYIQGIVVTISSGIVSSGKNIFLVLILCLFNLIEYRMTNRKISYAFAAHAKGKILRVIRRIIMEIVHYLSIKTAISLLTGVLVFLVSMAFGLNYAILWGFLAFVMNFIPTFGSIFSCTITTIFAILQFYPNYPKSIIFLIIIILINFFIGNIIEPRVQGKNLGLSPFVIIVSLTLWGYIWGTVGMIIAVPMTVIIKIVCENISYLHPLAILLGNDPKQTKRDFQ